MDELDEPDKNTLIQLAVESERKRQEREEKRKLKNLKQRETRRKQKELLKEENPIQLLIDNHAMKSKERTRRTILRETILKHYGNRCACCGEDIQVFLSVDHINEDGAEHRKEVGSGTRLYKWLIDNDFPDGFQLLCRNCNWGKHRNNGICPHKA